MRNFSPTHQLLRKAHAMTRSSRSSEQSSWAKQLTLAAMSLGYGVVQLDVTIVNTALSSIGSSLGGGVSELQWVVYDVHNRFRCADIDGRRPRRPHWRQACVHHGLQHIHRGIACLRAGAKFSRSHCIRAVQGLGAAILVPNSLALLNHAYPKTTERGRAVGIWAAGASLALTAGPLVGGALIALVGWRSIFLVNLPIGLGGLWLTWRYVTDTTKAPRQLDLPGQALAMAMLGVLAAALIEGGRIGWADPWILGGFAAFVALFVLFLIQEGRASDLMLPLSLFKHRMFALTALDGLLVNVAFYGLIFVLSLYFQQINKMSPFMTGLAFVPMMGSVLPVNLIAPRLAERIGAPAVIAIGALIAAAGCLALLGIDRGTSYWAVCAQLIGMGGGLGLLVPPLTSTLLGSVETSRSGIAAGVLNSTRQTGSVLGVALFGSLIGQGNGFLFGAKVALLISAALLVAAAAAIAIGGRMKKKALAALVDDPRAQRADASDLDFERVAGLHPQLRLAAVADAFGRSGGDDVAGRQRGKVGAERDDLRDRIDQEISRRVLHLLVVEPRHQCELARIGDFVGGDEPWAERAGAGKVLAGGDGKLLIIAHAAVDEAGIAGDVIERVLGLDVPSGFADDDGEFALEIEIVGQPGRIISPSWPTSVSVKRTNMLGCFGSSRPVSAAWDR